MNLFIPFQENPFQSPGSGVSMISYIIEIVVLLSGAFILGWLVSYFSSRVKKQKLDEMKVRIKDQEDQIKRLKETSNNLQEELSAIKLEKSELENQLSVSDQEKGRLATGIWENQHPSMLTEKMEKEKQFIEQDQTENNYDLTSVEGIDERIETLLHDAGIHSLVHLANCSVAHLKKLLENSGDVFKDYNPDFWPEQAKMSLDKIANS